MDTEIVIDSNDGTRVYVETGVEYGDTIIDLHVEDSADTVDLRLDITEALTLIDALTRAVRTAYANR